MPMNETQEYMAKLGDLFRALCKARDREDAALKAKLKAEHAYTDAMVMRHNAQTAYNEHVLKLPVRKPGDRRI